MGGGGGAVLAGACRLFSALEGWLSGGGAADILDAAPCSLMWGSGQVRQ